MSEQGERLVTPWTVCKFFQGNPDAVKYGDDPSLKVTNFIQWYDEGDWVSGLVPRLRHKDFHKVEICILKQDVIEAICSCGRNQCFHMAAMLLHVQNKKLVQDSELMTRLTEDVFYLTNKEMPDHKFGADIVYQGRVSNGSQYQPAVIAFFTCPNEIQQKINMLVTLDNKQDQRGVLLKFPKILGDVQFDSEQGKFVAIEDTGSCSLLKYINLPEEEKKVKGNCSRFFRQLVSTMKFIHSEKCYLKYFDPDSISVSSDEQRIEIDAFASVARCDTDQELVQAQSDNVFALGGLIDFIVRKGASEFSFSNLNQNKTRIWDVSEFKTQALGEWMQPVSQMLDADNRRPRLFDLLFPTCDQELEETLVTQKEDYVTPLPEEETLGEILEETLVVQRNDHGFLVSEKKKALTLQTEDYLASLPETSLLIKLPPTSTYKGLFRYCAISMSSGREVSKYDKNTTTVLDGIQPGDKYEVLVYEVKEKTERLIAKSIKQTKKFIGKDGGIVEVGCCILDFPEGAIKDETFIEIDRSHKNFPRLPENTISIAPIMDFRSTQSVFLKPVSCKITTPYVTSPTPVKLEIICYENGRWDHVCYGELDGDSKVVEFKCDHFTPYAEIIPKPFTEIRHMDIQFDIRNRIYIDEHNIACVTYLDHKPIVENFEPELSAYQLSAFVLRKSFLRVGEHFDFSLKSVMPDREFGNWRVTLDEEFVRNDWSSTEVFPIDRHNFPTPVVLSQFMRRHSDYTQPEYTARARLDFEKQLGGGNVTQPIVCQGGYTRFNIQGRGVNIFNQ